MDQDHQAEEIRRAMAEVRRDVDANTAEVFNRAREMADWRYHVRKYPKLSLAAAAVIGYLVVPAKRRRAPVGRYAADRSLGSGKGDAISACRSGGRGWVVAHPATSLMLALCGGATLGWLIKRR